MGLIKENRETTDCFGKKVNSQHRKQFDITFEFQVLLQAVPNTDPMLSTSITSEMARIGYCSIVSRAAPLLPFFTSVKQ